MTHTFLDYLAVSGLNAPARAASRSTAGPLPWGRGGGLADRSYAGAASRTCTLPTFTSRTDYCSQFGFAYEDDRKTMQMVRQQTDKLDAIWEEFSRTFDGHRPEAVVREAFGDYYQRLDWLEAVVINLLPGITFATYGTVRATFVAARCQGAEALRCLTRPGATSSPVLPPQRRAITG